MTVLVRKSLHGAIEECLAQATAAVEPAGSGRWTFSMADGAAAKVRATAEEDWLTMMLPQVSTLLDVDDWSLLERNESLPGLWKFTVNGRRGARQLRADLPLEADGEPAALAWRLREACEDLRELLHGLRGSPECTAFDTSGAQQQARVDAGNLAHLVKEAGWSCLERTPGNLVADLEVRDGFGQAAIESREDNRVAVHSDIARYGSLSREQHQALGLYLLAAGGALRMARTTVVSTGEGVVARSEVRLTSPGPAELRSALAALSVAFSLCSREAQCFEDERVARMYLSTRREKHITPKQ